MIQNRICYPPSACWSGRSIDRMNQSMRQQPAKPLQQRQPAHSLLQHPPRPDFQIPPKRTTPIACPFRTDGRPSRRRGLVRLGPWTLGPTNWLNLIFGLWIRTDASIGACAVRGLGRIQGTHLWHVQTRRGSNSIEAAHARFASNPSPPSCPWGRARPCGLHDGAPSRMFGSTHSNLDSKFAPALGDCRRVLGSINPIKSTPCGCGCGRLAHSNPPPHLILALGGIDPARLTHARTTNSTHRGDRPPVRSHQA